MANKRRNAGKERFWRSVFERLRRSPLSVREFCRREALSEPSLYAWRRTLRQRDGQTKSSVLSRQAMPPVMSRPA